MKRLFFFGSFSALLLALFLIVRPVVTAGGVTAMPDTAGRARELLPVERADRVMAAAGSTTSTAAPAPAPKAGTPLSEVEQQIVALINEVRQREDVPALTIDAALHRTARNHGRDMIERRFIDTINPDGLTVEDRVSRENRRAVGTVVESFGSASTRDRDLARRIVGDWLGNPSERVKLLCPYYMQIGVGVVPSATDTGVRAVQVLGRTIALTDADIPATARAGSVVRVVAAPAPANEPWECDAVDVFSPGTGLAVVGPVPFGNVALKVPAGVYKLRFRCAAGGEVRMHAGPRIEVMP